MSCVVLVDTGAQYVSLRGKAMECVGLIGEAVTDEVFQPDALEVMTILLSAMVRMGRGKRCVSVCLASISGL